MGANLPKEFFNIVFFTAGKEHARDFQGVRYRIIGEDDVCNFIGEAVGGTIYLLDATAQKGRELVYLAKDRKTLAAAIRIYQRHRGKAMTADMDAQLHRGEDREEELARKEAAGLKEKLFALDPAMFRDEFTFWSPLLEEIERGMI